jgi:flagellar motor switch protein FliG
MTRRAGELLREEIAAQGSVRRSDVDAARHELVSLARKLIEQGDIRVGNHIEDEDLVE